MISFDMLIGSDATGYKPVTKGRIISNQVMRCCKPVEMYLKPEDGHKMRLIQDSLFSTFAEIDELAEHGWDVLGMCRNLYYQ